VTDLDDARADRDSAMPLMGHLVELRTRILRSLVAVGLGAVIGWVVYHPVRRFLMEPLVQMADKSEGQIRADFISLAPLEQFMLRIKMSTYIGLVLAMPVVLWQIWQFVAPGLYRNERRYAGAFIGSSILLFVLGAAIAYWTLPAALDFLTAVGGKEVTYQYTAENYLMLIIYMMVAFGLGFEFPVLLVMLQLVGVLEPQQLARFRRFAIVGNAIIAAVITPSADPISMSALLVPMCILYEVAILIGRLVVRRRRRSDEAERAAG